MPLLGQRGAERVAVVATASDQLARWRQQRGEWVGALVFVHLAFCEHHDDGAAVAVADGVQVGIPPALGAADAPIRCPLLSRLAPVRWAFRWRCR
jgi:hypothetical protein